MAAERLEAICELIVDCPHKTAPRSDDVFGYAVGTTAIDEAGRVDLEKARPVNEQTYRAWTARAVPRPGDLIFCREAPVGPVALVPAGVPICLGQRTMLLRGDQRRVDPRWLAFKLRDRTTLRTLLSRSEGSTVAHLNVSEVRQFELEVPHLAQQRAIADVLTALDDKIESNRLVGEGLAGVALMFAANSGVAGTRTRTLAELGTQIKTPGRASEPYVGLDVMPRGGAVLQEWASVNGPNGASWAFEPGDILFGKLRPYFRKVAVAPIGGRCTREIVVLRPSEERYYGLLLATVASQSFIDFCTAVSTGTKMPRAEWKDASRFKIGMPDDRTLAAQTHLARINYAAAAGLVHEARTLTAIRGALLPKLVSGQIRIPLSDDVEEGVGAAIEALA